MKKWIKRIIYFIVSVIVLIVLVLALVPDKIDNSNKTLKKLPSCTNDEIHHQGNCSKVENIKNNIAKDLEFVDSLPSGSARTDEQIRIILGPISSKYFNEDSDYKVVELFEQVLSSWLMKRDEKKLRFLLDFSYYQDKYLEVAYPSFSEGLRDSIIPFITEQPDILKKVSIDQDQYGRGEIGDAFIQYIDFFSIDSKTRKINDPAYSDDLRALHGFLEKNGLFK